MSYKLIAGRCIRKRVDEDDLTVLRSGFKTIKSAVAAARKRSRSSCGGRKRFIFVKRGLTSPAIEYCVGGWCTTDDWKRRPKYAGYGFGSLSKRRRRR